MPSSDVEAGETFDLWGLSAPACDTTNSWYQAILLDPGNEIYPDQNDIIAEEIIELEILESFVVVPAMDSTG